MKVPYSYNEANILCNEFQHLAGTHCCNSGALIEAVVITPFDQLFKHRFFLFYHLFENDATAALAHEYDGTFFDVMVIMNHEEEGYKYEDLNAWLGQRPDGPEYPACPLPLNNAAMAYMQ